MKRLIIVSLSALLVASTAPNAFGWSARGGSASGAGAPGRRTAPMAARPREATAGITVAIMAAPRADITVEPPL